MRKYAFIFAALFSACVFAEDTLAPSVAYVYPAGGRAGCKGKVILGGINLGNARDVVVSGGGVKASIGAHILPLRQGEVARVRHNLEKEYVEKHPEIVE